MAGLSTAVEALLVFVLTGLFTAGVVVRLQVV